MSFAGPVGIGIAMFAFGALMIFLIIRNNLRFARRNGMARIQISNAGLSAAIGFVIVGAVVAAIGLPYELERDRRLHPDMSQRRESQALGYKVSPKELGVLLPMYGVGERHRVGSLSYKGPAHDIPPTAIAQYGSGKDRVLLSIQNAPDAAQYLTDKSLWCRIAQMTDGGRRAVSTYDCDSKMHHYSVILKGGGVVEAASDVLDIATLKEIVHSVNFGDVEKLLNDGS